MPFRGTISSDYWFNQLENKRAFRSTIAAPRIIIPTRTTTLADKGKLINDADIDFSTEGPNKYLTASQSNGKQFAFTTVTSPQALIDDTDIDFTTLAPGRSLIASSSNGKNFAFGAPASLSTAPYFSFDADVDFSTVGANKFLTASSSRGYPYSFASPIIPPQAFATDTDIDFTTHGNDKYLTATPSNGKPYSFQSPQYPAFPTLEFASDTDIDFSTQGSGKFLTEFYSNGKPYSFQTPPVAVTSVNAKTGIIQIVPYDSSISIDNTSPTQIKIKGVGNASTGSGGIATVQRGFTVPAIYSTVAILVSSVAGFVGGLYVQVANNNSIPMIGLIQNVNANTLTITVLVLQKSDVVSFGIGAIFATCGPPQTIARPNQIPDSEFNSIDYASTSTQSSEWTESNLSYGQVYYAQVISDSGGYVGSPSLVITATAPTNEDCHITSEAIPVIPGSIYPLAMFFNTLWKV